MLSNEELIDALFSQDEPDWYELIKLSVESHTDHIWVQALRLMWLEQHKPDEFDEVICELVE